MAHPRSPYVHTQKTRDGQRVSAPEEAKIQDYESSGRRRGARTTRTRQGTKKSFQRSHIMTQKKDIPAFSRPPYRPWGREARPGGGAPQREETPPRCSRRDSSRSTKLALHRRAHHRAPPRRRERCTFCQGGSTRVYVFKLWLGKERLEKGNADNIALYVLSEK